MSLVQSLLLVIMPKRDVDEAADSEEKPID